MESNLFETAKAREAFDKERVPDQAVVETETEGVFTIDASGRILTASSAAGRVFGCSSHDLIGQNVRSLMTERNSDPVLSSNAELEQRVQERTHQLEELVDELEGFCHSIAHDLRTPLRSINGYARIIITDYSGKLDEEGKGYLEAIAAGAVKIGNLMDALLAYARIGRTPIEPAHLNLSDMADSVVNSLETQGEFTIQPGLQAEGDPDLVRMLLENLFENATKYVVPGKAPKVEFGRTDRTYFVRDQGIGFDMRWVEKLFEPFQRLHLEKEYPGTGIGLANVRRIVHKHGGEVWAESELGKGSTFFFTLGQT